MFEYETPLCKEFKEFNYLLKIDEDVLTGDLSGFKTYKVFTNTWLYEWNDQIPWVSNKPLYDDELKHTYDPILFKHGYEEWPTCNWKEDGICNGRNLPGKTQVDDKIYFASYDWYYSIIDCKRKHEALKEKARLESDKDECDAKMMSFWDWVHLNFNDYTKLDQRLQWRLKKEWDELQDDYESHDNESSNHQYLDTKEEPLESNDDKDDDYTDGLEDYLICNRESNFVNEKAKVFKK